MAQKTAAAHKKLAPHFSNEVKMMKLTYDFANDGGATSDTYVIGTTGHKILVLDSRTQVETAFTSGGSATLKIGVSGVDDDAFLDTTSGAVASLVDDNINSETAGQNVVLASGAKIEATIGTAAMTAGKINLILRYIQID